MRYQIASQRKLVIVFLMTGLLCITMVAPAAAQSADCLKETDDDGGHFYDCRSRLGTKFLIGLGIDNFAAGELGTVLNPDDANDNRERFVGGFDIQYRLWRKHTEKKDAQGNPVVDANGNVKGNTRALWVRALTFHGVRSTDVDCTAAAGEDPGPAPGVNALCSLQTNAFDPSDLNAGETATFLLREASSLEGFGAVRYEFRSLGREDKDKDRPSGVLYLLGQLGFLTVDGSNDDVIDNHMLAIGAAITEGNLVDSFLEVGWGRTELYGSKSDDRLKVRAFVNWSQPDAKTKVGKRTGAFAGIVVDSDFGSGSDSVQTYIGVSFNLSDLSPDPS